MTTKEICDKSAFRENGYLIEKQKSAWHLSIPLRIAEILRDIPRAYSPFLNEFKRCYNNYYGYDPNENRLSSFLVRASYITAKTMSEQKELAEFSAAFRALPYAQNEILSTPQAPVFTFVIKLSENKRLVAFAKVAGETLATAPAANVLARFFHENEPQASVATYYLPPKNPPENLQNALSAWIEERFPAQAEKGFPLQTSLGVFANAFNPAFSPNEFEKELIAARFPFLAVLSATQPRPLDVAIQAVLRELAGVENAPKAKTQRSSKHLTETEKDEIIFRNYSDGLSIREIAAEYGKTEKTIRAVFDKKGITPKRARKAKKERFIDGKSYQYG